MRKVLQKLALLGIIASLSAFTLGGCQKTTESKETQTEAKSEAKADETKQEEETESTDKAMQYVEMAYGPETDNSATATAKGVDGSGKDLVRACFLSHDPEALFRTI